MKILNLKKLSWKIALIVSLSVFIIAVPVAFYFEGRVIFLTDQNSKFELLQQVDAATATCDAIFIDSTYKVASLKNHVESTFNVNEYTINAENYFDNVVRTNTDIFVYNIVKGADYISSAYFAVHPHLAGYPLVKEVYYEKTKEGRITSAEPQSYEEYMKTDSEEMIWFYGAYNSGNPYWTHIHEYEGEYMVSYVEPVKIGGAIVGVVGIDISIDQIHSLVKNIKVYDTGFALLQDNHNEFLESNDLITRLSPADKERFTALSRANSKTIFEISLAGIDYIVTQASLINDYNFYILAPKKEFSAETRASIIKFMIVFPTIFVIVIILANLVGKAFSKPLVALSAFMTRASRTGDISLTEQDLEVINKYAAYKDEIGQTVASSVDFINRISHVSKVLKTTSTGDLTTKFIPLSEHDVMGISLNEMNTKLNAMFAEINQSASQVSAGSMQVADGAQILAQGAAEQAAAIEELSSSITEIAKKTKSNADMAEKASQLAGTMKSHAENGSRQMDDMIFAVNDVNEASSSINMVIKVIDDIAFQTNILALNAAVEAARAGAAGKGFAVVAEEVRNLAAKSAEAAKETGSLIENSIVKANLGARIAGETAASLAEIVAGVNESSKLVADIASASEEQSLGIEQIHVSIDQLAEVVQQNSATAEESAAVSQEMSGQSVMLQELISQFKTK